jgi:D-glycero-alpha-D-manno-heptose 1-phosphate guanylyltransferase
MSSALPLAGIDVAILVGGLGKRLRGVIGEMPKPLAPILGRPFLFYVLDMLALRGARTVTLCGGFKSEVVEQIVGSEWLGMGINHSVEKKPMGTAGALALCRGFLQTERVLVMNGDTWFEPDFSGFLSTAGDSDVCVAARRMGETARYGSLEANSDGFVPKFNEKSAAAGSGLINGGVYLCSQDALHSLAVEPSSLEKDVLPVMASDGRVKAYESCAPFLDIGIPKDYEAAPGFFEALGIAPVEMFPDAPDMREAAVKLGTCIVISDGNGRFVLEKRADCGWWGLPGGRVDAGETVLAGALREAEEETGLFVEVTEMLGVFSDPRRRTVRYPDNGDLRQLADIALLARPSGGALTASAESSDVDWFAPCDFPLNTVPPAVEILRAACTGTAASAVVR